MRSAFRRNEERSAWPDEAPRRSSPHDVRVIVGEREGLTRASFLRRVAIGASATSAVTVAVLGLPRLATSAPSAEQDRSILNFLLLLERTQASFYAEALRRASLDGELRQFAEVAAAHERAHVAELVGLLGSAAEPPPRLALGSATADAAHVRAAAVALEDLALDGYNGQAPNLTPGRLRTVLRIASVEARHAGWVRGLAGAVPAPRAADPLPGQKQVLTDLHETDIVTSEAP